MLAQAKDVKRKIRVRNSSPSLLTVYWVNPNTKEYIQQYEDDLFPGASNNINSIVTHEFAVVEVINGCLLADGRRGGGKLSAKHLKSKKKSREFVPDSEGLVYDSLTPPRTCVSRPNSHIRSYSVQRESIRSRRG